MWKKGVPLLKSETSLEKVIGKKIFNWNIKLEPLQLKKSVYIIEVRSDSSFHIKDFHK